MPNMQVEREAFQFIQMTPSIGTFSNLCLAEDFLFSYPGVICVNDDFLAHEMEAWEVQDQ